MRVPLIVIAAMAVFATPANAEPTANEVLAKIDKGETFALYMLAAFENGASWANALLKHDGKARLYCTPDKLAMAPEETARILQDRIKDDATLGQLPAGLAVILAFQKTFPC